MGVIFRQTYMFKLLITMSILLSTFSCQDNMIFNPPKINEEFLYDESLLSGLF